MAWSEETDNVVRSTFSAGLLAALLAAFAVPASAQGIYTCTDSKGRRLTADRPIIDCIDREQTELSPGGIARRKIGPAPTAVERAAEEQKLRRQEEERSRQADDKKRERALVTRYPERAVHDKERAEALALVDSVTAAAQKRTKELQVQRKFLDGEVEFYQINPSRMPPKLKRQIEEVDKQLDAQRRFVADQEVEKVRVNARFDEELSRLKVLWAQQQGTPVPATTVARAASATRPASSSATR
jgi:TolA-binding protein